MKHTGRPRRASFLSSLGSLPFFSVPASRPLLSSRRLAPALILPLLLTVTGAAGCGSSETPEKSEPSAETTPVSLEIVATIGCADCDDASAITPTVLALLGGGRVAVLDRYEPFVRIFDATGELERAFGNKGQGPGELGTDIAGSMYFSGVYMLPWPDGSLSVLELVPAALETFTADGTFREQHTLDLPFAAPSAQAFAPGAAIYFRYSLVPASPKPDMIQRCTINLGAASECGDFADPESFMEPAEGRNRSRVAMAATADGGLLVAGTDTYRIWALGTDGAVVTSHTRAIARPQKSDEELAAERAANEARQARGLRNREIDASRGHIAAAGLQVDGAGRIWVLTQRHASNDSVFDVLDVDGNFLQEITVASMIRFDGYQITPFVAAGSRLAALALQPDGSTRVDIYEIVEQ